jgi:beta-galactosidase
MRTIIDFNDDWRFEGRDTVQLPHNAVELPFRISTKPPISGRSPMKSRFLRDPAWDGREVCCVSTAPWPMPACAQRNQIAHKDGYTPFEARLTRI